MRMIICLGFLRQRNTAVSTTSAHCGDPSVHERADGRLRKDDFRLRQPYPLWRSRTMAVGEGGGEAGKAAS